MDHHPGRTPRATGVGRAIIGSATDDQVALRAIIIIFKGCSRDCALYCDATFLTCAGLTLVMFKCEFSANHGVIFHVADKGVCMADTETRLGLGMLRAIRAFGSDTSGAVTVDWVVLTASIIFLSVTAGVMTWDVSTSLAERIDSSIVTATVPPLDLTGGSN